MQLTTRQVAQKLGIKHLTPVRRLFEGGVLHNVGPKPKPGQTILPPPPDDQDGRKYPSLSITAGVSLEPVSGRTG